jgi:hypothetical protein
MASVGAATSRVAVRFDRDPIRAHSSASFVGLQSRVASLPCTPHRRHDERRWLSPTRRPRRDRTRWGLTSGHLSSSAHPCDSPCTQICPCRKWIPPNRVTDPIRPARWASEAGLGTLRCSCIQVRQVRLTKKSYLEQDPVALGAEMTIGYGKPTTATGVDASSRRLQFPRRSRTRPFGARMWRWP